MNPIEQQTEVEPASPEEEQQYEQAYEFAVRSLHTGQLAKNTVARVKNAQSIEKGIAEAVFVVVRKTEVQMDGLQDAVKIQLAEDILAEVLALLVDAGQLDEEAITDEMVETITVEMYQMYTQDAEQRGALDTKLVEEDVQQGQPMQGVNAMSNEAVSRGGLMNV